MDPMSPKKRPGGDIESPFALSRKVPKSTASAASPYAAPVPTASEDVLSEAEIALVRY